MRSSSMHPSLLSTAFYPGPAGSYPMGYQPWTPPTHHLAPLCGVQHPQHPPPPIANSHVQLLIGFFEKVEESIKSPGHESYQSLHSCSPPSRAREDAACKRRRLGDDRCCCAFPGSATTQPLAAVDGLPLLLLPPPPPPPLASPHPSSSGTSANFSGSSNPALTSASSTPVALKAKRKRREGPSRSRSEVEIAWQSYNPFVKTVLERCAPGQGQPPLDASEFLKVCNDAASMLPPKRSLLNPTACLPAAGKAAPAVQDLVLGVYAVETVPGTVPGLWKARGGSPPNDTSPKHSRFDKCDGLQAHYFDVCEGRFYLLIVDINPSLLAVSRALAAKFGVTVEAARVVAYGASVDVATKLVEEESEFKNLVTKCINFVVSKRQTFQMYMKDVVSALGGEVTFDHGSGLYTWSPRD